MPNSNPDAREARLSILEIFPRSLFSTDHKTIGLLYLWLALFSVFLGMAASLVMRISLVWPGLHLANLLGGGATSPQYSTLSLFHGSLMVFFVLTAAPQAGFGNYFLPLQIGAREMAFPALNRLSFWVMTLSLGTMAFSFLRASQSSLNIWLVSVALFCLGSLLGAINFSVTTIDLRAKGMSLPRLPATAWAWFVTSILGTLIFSVLLAACALIFSDRLLGTHFFSSAHFLTTQPLAAPAGELPILWRRLFWYFAQAEVYVAMLPCFGIITHLLSTFARKPVWMERAVVLALCAVGVFGFCIWGQHMFSSGMDPYSPLVFALLASSLGIPATLLLISWLGTLWKAELRLNTAMLFTLGFISLFMSGGISGIFLARSDLAAGALGNDFVTGHFHLVMGVAATFAILAALFFWFPKLFARRLNERIGKLHFWLTFAGVYAVFMPMHWMGMVAHARVSAGTPATAFALYGSNVRGFITAASLLTLAAQLLFLGNFLWTLCFGDRISSLNPWCSTTLEWSVSSPPPRDDFGVNDPVVYRGAYEFNAPDVADDFVPQHLAPEQVARTR